MASLPDQGGVSSQGRTPHNGFQDNDKYLEDSIRKRSMVLGPPSPWTPLSTWSHPKAQTKTQSNPAIRDSSFHRLDLPSPPTDPSLESIHLRPSVAVASVALAQRASTMSMVNSSYGGSTLTSPDCSKFNRSVIILGSKPLKNLADLIASLL